MIKKGISHLGIFFLGVLSLLPLSILYLMADGFYILLYHVFRYRRKIVRENLLNALPEKNDAALLRIEKHYYKYLASLIFEVIKMQRLSKKQIKKRFVFKNKSLIDEYLKSGQSILVCSAHYGNWEWGTMGIGLNFQAVHYPIYKPLSNPEFDQWFKKVRSRFGNKLIPMRQTVRALASHKNQPSIFSFGNDQAPARNESHYWTKFLHQDASIQLGIEKIAIKTNHQFFISKLTF